ncbi:MAG TPA: hypothetical protein VF407_15830 [Polyangiaceae bacterium]
MSATGLAEKIPLPAAADAGADLDASGTVADAGEAKTKAPSIDRTLAVDLLFTSMGAHETPPDCADANEAIHCLIDARYAKDDDARLLARKLFDLDGSVAGVDPEQNMDGGYRGILHLVPVLPTGASRVHLARVVSSFEDYEKFFAALEARGNAKVAYRWRAIALRFFRSVKARTPSAYAHGWTISYNVDGSLNGTDVSVRETMFHELFHTNDGAHGTKDDLWSEHALGPAYDKIVHECGPRTACLAKYAPNDTKVKGGTYYAFQPGNDVREYAAEMAIRYYKEQRGVLGLGPVIKPSFKCTGAINGASYKAVVDEFFGGIDLTPACTN